MSHTYAQNTIHLVFSTKDRHKSIPAELQPRLWSYIGGISKKSKIIIHAVNGMDDHVHVLIQIAPTMALSDAVQAIKTNSSRWASDEGHKFAWQQGYGAFSVSASNTAAVLRYIENQNAHHKRMTFDAEFQALLKKHRIEFDPKYALG
jgi:REP element-mobilizing transposase RayT